MDHYLLALVFTMSRTDAELSELVVQAAGVVFASRNKVGISKAMELVGFKAEERKKMKWYQQVRRLSSKVAVVEATATTPPVPVPDIVATAAENSNSTASSLTPNSAENPMPTRRRLLVEEGSTIASMTSGGSSSSNEKKKKNRRSTKELHRINAKAATARALESQALKVATAKVAANSELSKKDPNYLSANKIVEKVNKDFGSNIRTKTATRYVREGLIGVSPMKKGPVGDFPKYIYSALKGAFTTYVKLEQAASKKQSTTKSLSVLVNATVNAAGFNKTRDDLTRKLKKDTADQFSNTKANLTERRRLQWTTHYNLDTWFNTWKQLLIDLGFGRESTKAELSEHGEVVFFSGQLDRIGNLDETDGSIYETSGQRGGRPASVLVAPEITGGATAVNKSGSCNTIICGSTAAGDPLPPHFQLKTSAKSDETQRMSERWFRHTKDTVGKYGFKDRKGFPCTFGMNEKGGMNAIELHKYFAKSILPLYPDIEDVPLKRVIMKLDSGPGRLNLEMLAELRLKGLYLVPGVPNTTSKTQETDQNYGPFKNAYRSNIRTLTHARFEKDLSVTPSDLPLLVFGGVDDKTGAVLVDAFSVAFSLVANLAVWKKCGSVPLTRSVLQADGVRREVPVGAAAAMMVGEEEDSEIQLLRDLEKRNQCFCSILTGAGYDGSRLIKKAPTRETHVAVTMAHSKERIAALKKASAAGQMFFATGGKHLNSKEFFQAKESKSREELIKTMEGKKEARRIYCKEQKESVLMIKRKGELTRLTEKDFAIAETKHLLKWKKITIKATTKRKMADAHIAAPKPKIQKVWCRSEEASLNRLKELNIPLKETALGVAASQMAKAMTNNLAILDTPTKDSLRSALGDSTAPHPVGILWVVSIK